MKSASVAAAAAALAGLSVAQPHGHHGHQHHHAKRDLVTEWETVWETVTVLVDESTTQTLYPTTTGGAPGEFFQPPPNTSTSKPEPEPTVVETTSSTQAPPPPPPPTTTSASTTSSTSAPPPPPPAPTTTSTPKPAPAPAPETTSTQPAPAPAATDSSDTPASGSTYAGTDKFGTSSMDSAKYSGDITYYTLGLGACGYDDSGVDNSKHIVAISHADWYNRGSGTSLGINMPNHAWCDQTITITAGGKSTTALVHDICPGCEAGSIDVSESVFDALFGSLDAGRQKASWTFN
ncbi:RlpA-like double-psi beta-barrel-protein domain-containing protein-containing protein [Xylaria palmicola]|nr:RlpA-like double-psi beta-barrel-protein domain-containing protein-containing protein [Xylaria palmicola]